MAKVTAESREQFNKDSAAYKAKIKEILAQEKVLTSEISKDKTQEGVLKLELAETMLYAASVHILINNMSWEIMSVKNEDALNDARKLIYKAIIYLEDVVTNFIDVSYADLTKKQETITNINIEKRYLIIRKLGLSIRILKDAFGDNSKWKWSFVELEGRFTTVAKNLIDMKEASKDYFDPRSEHYETTVLYIRLITKLLNSAATGYRDRYELSTRRIDDMRDAIKYLLALRKLYIVLGNSEQAEEVKKKAIVWKDKMDADQKKGLSN